jgi:uncharacterized repeat protein (TIGR03803 family)
MNRKTLVCLSLIALVASLGPAAHAQTYSTFPPGSGGDPQAGVTIRGDFVYGTTASGGLGAGVVFEVKHLGDLFDFPGGNAAANPEARVVFGPDGHIYGTGSQAGSDGDGLVFKLIPNPTICRVAQCRPWGAYVLYSFMGHPDGAIPGHGDLIWDEQGNIYGTTTLGGTKNLGVVYEMMPPVPPSNSWTESVVWNFGGSDGENPQNAVIFDSNGNLLGTAKQGGANGFGTVFKLTPSGNSWTETNIYDFQGGTDGEYPIAGLMIDSSGNIYGATSDGGGGGGGTVFELLPSGNTYTFKMLYSFSGQQGMNCGPWGTLAMDPARNLYGTTYCNGANNLGSVFKLTNTQNGWVYASMHDFGSIDGDIGLPISNVSFEGNGNLWGTASRGESHTNPGGVWMIKP